MLICIFFLFFLVMRATDMQTQSDSKQSSGPADVKYENADNGYSVIKLAKPTTAGSGSGTVPVNTRVIVDRLAYDRLGSLGGGSYGSVYRVCDPMDCCSQFAIKVFNDTPPASVAIAKDNLNAYYRESILLSSVIPPHPSVVGVVGHGKNTRNDSAAIVMELMDGDLSSRRVDSYQLAVHVMYHMLAGLRHLHEHGVVHADIKPSNILTSADLTQVRLTDLSLSFRLHPLQVYALTPLQMRPEPDLCIATLWYRAPEVVAYGVPERLPRLASGALDLWAIGCVIWEMLNGKPLFPATPNKADKSEEFENFRMMQMCYKEFGVLPAASHVYQVDKKDGDRVLTGMLNDTVMALASKTFHDRPEKAKSATAAFMLMWNGLMLREGDMRWTAKQALESPVFDEYRDATAHLKGDNQAEMFWAYLKRTAVTPSVSPKPMSLCTPTTATGVPVYLPPPPPLPAFAVSLPPPISLLPLLPPPDLTPLPVPVKLVPAVPCPPLALLNSGMKPPRPRSCLKKPGPQATMNPVVLTTPSGAMFKPQYSASSDQLRKNVQFFPFSNTGYSLPMKA